MSRPTVDLVGQVFGRLVVLTRAADSADGLVCYRCICDCGEIAIVKSTCLRRGSTRSCGCLRREVARMSRVGQYGPATPERPVVRVDEDTADAIAAIAARRGISRQAVIDLVLADLPGAQRRRRA